MESKEIRELALEKAKNHHGDIELVDSLTKEGSAYYQGFLDGFNNCFDYWASRNNIISGLIQEKLGGYYAAVDFYEEVEKNLKQEIRKSKLTIAK